MLLFGAFDPKTPATRTPLIILIAVFFLSTSWSACDGVSDPPTQPDSALTDTDSADSSLVDTESTDSDTSIAPPGVVPLMTGFRVFWDGLPHRISFLELTFEKTPESDTGDLTGRNDGGPFGAIDTTLFEYDLEVWESSSLIGLSGAVELEIPPEAADFTVTEAISIPALDLTDASTLVAFLRGFRISTDQYDTPPDFESDPTLPYDPADGYTTQGIGFSLSRPTIDGENIVFDVEIRNSLGVADRQDMNAAIPEATTWVRVDYLVVGAFGSNTGVTFGQTNYTISEATYGQNTVHEHANLEKQQIELVGSSASSAALFGITAVDYWLNMEGHHDPECEVITDELNYLGEPVSGPGRYLRELSARLSETEYDAATGTGQTHLDMFLSNSSLVTEIGNLCLGLAGEVAMLQFDATDSAPVFQETVTLSGPSAEAMTTEVSF